MRTKEKVKITLKVLRDILESDKADLGKYNNEWLKGWHEGRITLTNSIISMLEGDLDND